MDFGEILKLWDAQQRPAARDAGDARRGGRPIRDEDDDTVAATQARWLDSHGVPRRSDDDDAPDARLSRRDIDALPIDAKIDLHGMTTADAETALAAFFTASERAGLRKVLIVHGRGLHSTSEPVLGDFVKRWLEKRASAGRSGHADSTNGGKGATWVLLKRTRDQRSR